MFITSRLTFIYLSCEPIKGFYIFKGIKTHKIIMRIDLDDEYKKLCYIQEIKPGKLNMSKIVIGTFLTLLTLGIPALLYWKWQRFKNFIHNAIF